MASILTTEIVGGHFSFMKLIHGAKAKTSTGIFNCLKVIFVFQHTYHSSTIPFKKVVNRRSTGYLNLAIIDNLLRRRASRMSSQYMKIETECGKVWACIHLSIT